MAQGMNAHLFVDAGDGKRVLEHFLGGTFGEVAGFILSGKEPLVLRIMADIAFDDFYGAIRQNLDAIFPSFSFSN